jgi:enolase
MKIKEVTAIQILDSRGNPTIKATVTLEKGLSASFSVPSGASTGSHEAIELRDGGHDFGGFGVKNAINNILVEIAPAIIGMEATKQREIDELMISIDGTENKSRLGANAILAVSGAVSRAAAKGLGLPLYVYLRELYEQDGSWQPELKLDTDFVLPKMFFNIINGGKHAENNLDVQEMMIVPQRQTISENVMVATEVYHSLKKVLKQKNLSTGLGDEGGFAPNVESNQKGLDYLIEAIELAGYKSKEDVCIALDVAATEIFESDKDEKYVLSSDNGSKIALNSHQMTSWYNELVGKYPIISIEDGLAEDDYEGWTAMTAKISDKVQLVGDDLFVTNIKRISEGIEKKMANAVLIKINQIGSITETFDAIRLATRNGYNCMISHRSGETEDSYIADLVVATGTGQIKSGAPARGERTAKYNRLLEIESELNTNKGE